MTEITTKRLQPVLTSLRRYTKQLMAISLMLIAVAGYGIVVYDRPYTETGTITAFGYSMEAEYNYSAKLKPSLYYNNATTLRSGEGPFYTNIIKKLYITMNYDFKINNKPYDSRKKMTLDFYLEAPDLFKKKLLTEEISRHFNFTRQAQGFQLELDIDKMREYYNGLTFETAIRESSFLLTIEPKIEVSATSRGYDIKETHYPIMNLDFTSDIEGNKIVFEEVQSIKTGSITEEITVPALPNNTIISLSYLAYYLFAACFLSFGLIHAKVPLTEKKEPLGQELVKKYQDIVVQSRELTDIGKGIEVPDFEDIKKLADYLMKPILYYIRDDEYVFYLIDENTTYIYHPEKPAPPN